MRTSNLHLWNGKEISIAEIAAIESVSYPAAWGYVERGYTRSEDINRREPRTPKPAKPSPTDYDGFIGEMESWGTPEE